LEVEALPVQMKADSNHPVTKLRPATIVWTWIVHGLWNNVWNLAISLQMQHATTRTISLIKIVQRFVSSFSKKKMTVVFATRKITAQHAPKQAPPME
jgi:hypothetical protein